MFVKKISYCDEFMQRLTKFVDETLNPEHGLQDTGADGDTELNGGGGSEIYYQIICKKDHNKSITTSS